MMKSKKTNHLLSLIFGLIVLGGLIIAELRSASQQHSNNATHSGQTQQGEKKQRRIETPADNIPLSTEPALGYHRSSKQGEFVREDADKDSKETEPSGEAVAYEATESQGDSSQTLESALPPDLQAQLRSPQRALPADLQAQLNAPPPPIPEDIQRALSAGTRIVSEEEVNSPSPEIPSAFEPGASSAQ